MLAFADYHAAVPVFYNMTDGRRVWVPTDLGSRNESEYDAIAQGLANDTVMTELVDSSTHTRDLPAIDGGAVYKTTGINGHPGILFAGADRFQASFGATIAQPAAIVLVLSNTGAVEQIIADGFDNTHRFDVGSDPVAHITNAFAGSALTSAPEILSTPVIVTVVFDGASARIRRNGVEQTLIDTNVGSQSLTGQTIGGRHDQFLGNYFFWEGYLGRQQLISAVTNDDIAGAEYYAGNRYTITAAHSGEWLYTSASVSETIDQIGRFGMVVDWTPNISAAAMLSGGYANPRFWSLDENNYAEINLITRGVRVCVGGTLTALPTSLPAWNASDRMVVALSRMGSDYPFGTVALNGAAPTSLGTGALLPPLVTVGIPLDICGVGAEQSLPGTITRVTVTR